jgi:hypothetical protein
VAVRLMLRQVNVRLPAIPASADDATEYKKELITQYEYLLDQMFKAKVFAAVVGPARWPLTRLAELYSPVSVLA